MADHGKPEYATATGNDYAEHESTYLNVMKLTKLGTLVCLAVVVSLAIFATADSKLWMIVGLVLTIISGLFGMASKEGNAVPLVGTLVFLLLVLLLV